MSGNQTNTPKGTDKKEGKDSSRAPPKGRGNLAADAGATQTAPKGEDWMCPLEKEAAAKMGFSREGKK